MNLPQLVSNSVKVSLAIATHNRSQRLNQAIASVLNQSYGNFELLVWDDSSSDNTWEIVERYSQADGRVRALRGSRRGAARSLIAALDQAEGSYLGWLGDDDILDSQALAQTVALLEARPSIGVVYTDYVDIDEHNQILGYGDRCGIPYSAEGLLTDFMTGQFRLMRRELYEQIGGLSPFYRYAYDYELCLRLSEVTEFERLPQPLYFYRYHDQARRALLKTELLEDAERAAAQARQRRQEAAMTRLPAQPTEPALLRSGDRSAPLKQIQPSRAKGQPVSLLPRP